MRAKYNLTLTDAFQAASAVIAGCEGFLTNDALIKRVSELNVITLDEVEIFRRTRVRGVPPIYAYNPAAHARIDTSFSAQNMLPLER